MRKVIFAINITINGFADHTVGIADADLHNFFSDLLDEADVILFGRKTYQLMESYWPIACGDPRSTESEKRFAGTINPIKKIVFSNSLKKVDWQNSDLAEKDLVSTVSELKRQEGKPVSIGSINIASQLFKENLIDEFWFAIHPVISEKGPRLFDGTDVDTKLQFVDLKKLGSGVIILHFKKSEAEK
jgi:dihydrofolate reductase